MAGKVPSNLTTFLKMLKPPSTAPASTGQEGKKRKRPTLREATEGARAGGSSSQASPSPASTGGSEPERRRPTSVGVAGTAPVSSSSPSPRSSSSPTPRSKGTPVVVDSYIASLLVPSKAVAALPTSRVSKASSARPDPSSPLPEGFQAHAHIVEHLGSPTCVDFLKTHREVRAFAEVEKRLLQSSALAALLKEIYANRLREAKDGLGHAKRAERLEKQVAPFSSLLKWSRTVRSTIPRGWSPPRLRNTTKKKKKKKKKLRNKSSRPGELLLRPLSQLVQRGSKAAVARTETWAKAAAARALMGAGPYN